MSGLITELIRKPLIKGMLRGRLKGITPEGARAMVRSVLWQDIEVILGIAGSLPSSINAIAAAVGALADEVNGKLSPELIRGFAESLLKDVDQDILKDSARSVAALNQKMIETSPELKALLIEKGPRIIASGIKACTASVNATCRQDPKFLSGFITSVIENLDRPALSEATLNLTEAFLDQRLGLISWSCKLIKRRVEKRFRRTGR
jgi:hypothetical protein